MQRSAGIDPRQGGDGEPCVLTILLQSTSLVAWRGALSRHKCMFGWLKEYRHIVQHFDRLAKSYAAMLSWACAMRSLRHYFSYSA